MRWEKRRLVFENAPQSFGFYVFCRPFLRGKTEEFKDKIQKVMLPWSVGMTLQNAIWPYRLTGLGQHPFKVQIRVRAPVGSP